MSIQQEHEFYQQEHGFYQENHNKAGMLAIAFGLKRKYEPESILQCR